MTHPSTLMAIMNIATMYTDGLKDFSKGEDMVRFPLDGSERSLGKDHAHTKDCAYNLNIILEEMGRHDEKAALETIYPEPGI